MRLQDTATHPLQHAVQQQFGISDCNLTSPMDTKANTYGMYMNSENANKWHDNE